MLMMRLQRIGRRNEAHFKIVVIEKTKGPKSHRYVDILGSYNPKIGSVILDEDKVTKWLKNGVQPSDTVFNMLVSKGLVEGRKKNVLPKKSPTKKRNAPDEEPETEAPVPVAESSEEETPVETTEETIIEEVKEETSETPVEESTPEPEVVEDSKEEVPVETTEETIIEEVKEETSETPVEEPTKDESTETESEEKKEEAE